MGTTLLTNTASFQTFPTKEIEYRKNGNPDLELTAEKVLHCIKSIARLWLHQTAVHQIKFCSSRQVSILKSDNSFILTVIRFVRKTMIKDKWNIKIERATLDDLPAIQELCVETVRSTCKKDYDQAQINVWTASVENEVRWKEAVTQQYFLVAIINSTIVGFGSLKDGDYIDFMYVHKDYGRQGIADKLYQALENESKRLGYMRMTSDVSKTARPFFEKKGFKVVKENKHIIKGIELINYRMIKS